VKKTWKIHLQYTIHNPTLEWACCNYVNAQHGNICEHQLKILMFFHPNLVRGKNYSVLWIIERDFPMWVEKPT
jgi:hypothetical protein